MELKMFQIESMKTTSMEPIGTGVLDKNKEHYLRSKDKAEKSYDVFRHIQLHMSKYKKIRLLEVNPRHQTPQGQSVAKLETPLKNIQVDF